MVYSGLYAPNNLVIQLFLNNQLSSNLEQQKINIYLTAATVAGIKINTIFVLEIICFFTIEQQLEVLFYILKPVLRPS